MSLASLERAQNGIPRLAKTIKESERFLMTRPGLLHRVLDSVERVPYEGVLL